MSMSASFVAEDLSRYSVDGVYRARWIVPMSRPPIKDGLIEIRNGQVVFLGHDDHRQSVIDLGDVALLPRLVNPHTHLAFSHLEKPIGQPGMDFPQWIKQVIQHRIDNPTTPLDVQTAIARGVQQSADFGVSLIGEIATLPWPLPAASNRRQFSQECSCDLIVFAELLGLTEERQSQLFQLASELESQLAEAPSSMKFAISPHAPYSTAPSLVDRAVARAIEYRAPVAMHLAESAAEMELLATGTGAFRELLEGLGIWQTGMFPRGDGIMGYLKQLARAPHGLIVHGNFLDCAEMDFIGEHSQLTVVYCPRTHAYFQHPRHPLPQLLDRGIRVALGTDSVASSPDLELWEEARTVMRLFPEIPPATILGMITIAAAEALGDGQHGRIQLNRPARLLSVPVKCQSEKDLFEEILSKRPHY